MKDCLKFIIDSILGEETLIKEEENPQGEIILMAEPKPENMGKVIGKRGKIIDAIRKLVKIRAAKEGKKVILRITDQLQKENGVDLVREEEGEATISGNIPS